MHPITITIRDDLYAWMFLFQSQQTIKTKLSIAHLQSLSHSEQHKRRTIPSSFLEQEDKQSMNSPGQKKETPDRDMTELQDGRKPLKKRKTSEDQLGDPASQPSDQLTHEERRIEARRRSNRLSARRCRKRTKSTIQVLETQNDNLRDANKALTKQLEKALLKNHRLQLLMENGHQVAMERNGALQLLLERPRPKPSAQDKPRAFNKRSDISYPKFANTTSNASYNRESLNPSIMGALLQQERQATRAGHFHEYAMTAQGTSPTGIATKPTFKSLRPSHSIPHQSRQESILQQSGQESKAQNPNRGYSSSASVADTRMSVNYLEQELKKLKEQYQS